MDVGTSLACPEKDAGSGKRKVTGLAALYVILSASEESKEQKNTRHLDSSSLHSSE